MINVSESEKLNILIVYSAVATHINTVQEYLKSFQFYSKHNIYFANGIHQSECLAHLSLFDVVVLHYSVRLHVKNYISPFYVEALQQFKGLKVLFIQDEYNNTNTAREWMNDLGIHLVFSCVPPQYKEIVYPSELLPGIEFVHVLTGAVPLYLESIQETKPLSERQVLIGYRGKDLPFYYGALGREKSVIGQRMRQICEDRGLPVDIEWREAKRIYGDAWYMFLQNCRATLGTESGSNVFDFDGELEKTIKNALKENPDLTYEEAYEKWIAPHDNLIKMNQISPKIFEAIALKTALVLFEGEYSGVVQPGVHFIPLKKDFSNVDEVLAKIQDDQYLQAMTERAYQDIIESDLYSYKKFVEYFDACIEQRIVPNRNRNLELITGVIGYRDHVNHEVKVFFPDFNEGLPLQSLLTYSNWKLIKPTSHIPVQKATRRPQKDTRRPQKYTWRRKPMHKLIQEWDKLRLGIRCLKREFPKKVTNEFKRFAKRRLRFTGLSVDNA